MQQLKENLLFRNIHYKHLLNLFDEMSLVRDSLNTWQCQQLKDKTFKLLNMVLKLVSEKMENCELSGFVDNIELVIMKLKLKMGKI